MFFPAAMRKVNIFLDEADVEPVTIAMARQGTLHLEETGDEEWCDEAEHWGTLYQKLTSRIQRLEELMDQLQVERPPLSPPKRISPDEDLENIDGLLEQAEQELHRWQNDLEKTRKEMDHLQILEREARLLAHFDLPMEEVRNADFFHWVVGTIPRDSFKNLRETLFEPPEEYHRRNGNRVHRVNVFLQEAEVEHAAEALTKLENFRFIEAKEEAWNRAAPHWAESAESYSRRARRLGDLMDILGLEQDSSFPPERQDFDRDAEAIDSVLDELEVPILQWRDRLKKTEQEVEDLQAVRAQLEILSPLERPVEEFQNARFLHWTAGRISPEQLENIHLALFRIPFTAIPLTRSPDRILLMAATDPDHAGVLDRALKDLFVERVSLPGSVNGTPKAALRRIEKRLNDTRERLQELNGERDRLQRRWGQRILSCFRQASFDAEVANTIAAFPYHDGLYMVSGWTPEAAVDEVALALETATGGRAEIEVMEPVRSDPRAPIEMSMFRIPAVVIPVRVEPDKVLVVAVTTPGCRDVLDRAMEGVFMEPLPLPEDLTSVPSEVLPEIRKRLREAEDRLSRLQNERSNLRRRWGHRLLAMWRQAESGRHIAQAVTRYARHENVFLVSGWIPEDEVDESVRVVETASAGRADVELVDPGLGGRYKPPTVLRNPRIFRPFEAITQTFGFPDYREIDPTPLTAVTFTLMYGVMFGDVGQGLLLASVGLLARRLSDGLMRRLGGVLTAAGLCGGLFGVLYGSVFGLEDIIPGLWLKPLESIPRLLAASVIGGTVLLTAGFLASMANAFRTRRWDALLLAPTGLAGLGLYWALIGGGYAVFKGLLPLRTLALAAALAALLLLLREPLSRLMKQERPLVKGGWATSGAQAFFELFETVISNISNTLSFVRLGAFAVAHAAFMRVIFGLAEASGDWGRWPILILGTLVVVAFEGLVVGIQAMRLEYYEFFNKFFQGQGSSFKPLRLFGGSRS